MSRKTFFCIDAHTCGNPVRVVAGGGPPLHGATMSEKRQHFIRDYDWIRTGLMFEPRGHDVMSGTILYEPLSADSDASLIFIETSGCLPMCGHGAIGTVTVLIEEGLVKPKVEGRLRLEVPAGIVEAEYRRDDSGNVVEVRIRNVPSFLYRSGLDVDVPGFGRVVFDVAYGGNFYAIVEPQESYRDLDDISAFDIQRLSPILRRLVKNRFINNLEHSDNRKPQQCTAQQPSQVGNIGNVGHAASGPELIDLISDPDRQYQVAGNLRIIKIEAQRIKNL